MAPISARTTPSAEKTIIAIAAHRRLFPASGGTSGEGAAVNASVEVGVRAGGRGVAVTVDKGVVVATTAVAD